MFRLDLMQSTTSSYALSTASFTFKFVTTFARSGSDLQFRCSPYHELFLIGVLSTSNLSFFTRVFIRDSISDSGTSIYLSSSDLVSHQ